MVIMGSRLPYIGTKGHSRYYSVKEAVGGYYFINLPISNARNILNNGRKPKNEGCIMGDGGSLYSEMTVLNPRS